MSSTKRLRLTALVVTVCGALSACSVVDFLEECRSSDCAGDAKIQAAVQKEIDAHPNLKSDPLYIQTIDHVVYLNGLVDTEFERQQLISLAQKVPGVKEVIDKLGIQDNTDR